MRFHHEYNCPQRNGRKNNASRPCNCHVAKKEQPPKEACGGEPDCIICPYCAAIHDGMTDYHHPKQDERFECHNCEKTFVLFEVNVVMYCTTRTVEDVEKYDRRRAYTATRYQYYLKEEKLEHLEAWEKVQQDLVTYDHMNMP